MVSSASTTFWSFGPSAVQRLCTEAASSWSPSGPRKPLSCSALALASQAPAPCCEIRATSSFSRAEEPSGRPPSHGALQGSASTAFTSSLSSVSAISRKFWRKAVTAKPSPSGVGTAHWLNKAATSCSTSAPPPSPSRRSRAGSSSRLRSCPEPSVSLSLSSSDLTSLTGHCRASTEACRSTSAASKRASMAASRQAASLRGRAKRALLLRKSNCPSSARLRCFAPRAISSAESSSSSGPLSSTRGHVPSSCST
mmetsp:Transcript_72325/g.211926  ORF Transcript_72325/g.211926 Transcript_72325/m.211926 type:complete len:254 (+) Transcript_72325:169-930(+)